MNIEEILTEKLPKLKMEFRYSIYIEYDSIWIAIYKIRGSHTPWGKMLSDVKLTMFKETKDDFGSTYLREIDSNNGFFGVRSNDDINVINNFSFKLKGKIVDPFEIKRKREVK